MTEEVKLKPCPFWKMSRRNCSGGLRLKWKLPDAKIRSVYRLIMMN